jgi:hypothetical protein
VRDIERNNGVRIKEKERMKVMREWSEGMRGV